MTAITANTLIFVYQGMAVINNGDSRIYPAGSIELFKRLYIVFIAGPGTVCDNWGRAFLLH